VSAPRVVIVTGAARGIGAAIAEAFVDENAAVVLADIDESQLAATADALSSRGGTAVAVRADITDAAAVDSLVSAALERFGRLDVLVNNAGRNTYFDAITMSEQDWDDSLNVDLKSAWLTSRAALPSLIDSTGCIVNVSSIHARMTTPGTFPYAVAKAGLEGLTRSLALDYGPQGVRVNAVAPGWTYTRLVDEWVEREGDPGVLQRVIDSLPMKRMADPADIAAGVVFLSGPSARAVTGAVLPIDCGLSATFRVG
jgi:NAD(P)-dependent dehydrogenase (short-subunit alcohol dehydrogenase family)